MPDKVTADCPLKEFQTIVHLEWVLCKRMYELNRQNMSIFHFKQTWKLSCTLNSENHGDKSEDNGFTLYLTGVWLYFINSLWGYHSLPHYLYDADSSFPPALPTPNSHLCPSSSFPFILLSCSSLISSALSQSCRLLSPCLSQIWYCFKGRIRHEL